MSHTTLIKELSLSPTINSSPCVGKHRRLQLHVFSASQFPQTKSAACSLGRGTLLNDSRVKWPLGNWGVCGDSQNGKRERHFKAGQLLAWRSCSWMVLLPCHVCQKDTEQGIIHLFPYGFALVCHRNAWLATSSLKATCKQ